jgi:opacity protein-like surface antigen
MKKLTLTFCALFALLVVAPAIYADGPERMSGKEVMQPAPPVCDFYRAHEWDMSIWGAWMFAADTGQFDVPDEDPFSTSIAGGPFFKPDQDPTLAGVGEPQLTNPNERVNIGQVSQNELFARDDTWGGGVDFKYFWSRYFGAGLEGVGIAAKTNFAGGGLLTLTGRYPFGRFAPYVTGGIGFIDGGATLYKFFNEKHTYAGGVVDTEREFWTVDPVHNHHLRALGQIGVGLEYRMTCHIGLMADFTWNFVFGQSDHSDKFRLITEQGVTDFDRFGDRLEERSVIISKAENLIPGHGSDNQDFGMVRFGVTFSY